jgi:hypothetical protein
VNAYPRTFPLLEGKAVVPLSQILLARRTMVLGCGGYDSKGKPLEVRYLLQTLARRNEWLLALCLEFYGFDLHFLSTPLDTFYANSSSPGCLYMVLRWAHCSIIYSYGAPTTSYPKLALNLGTNGRGFNGSQLSFRSSLLTRGVVAFDAFVCFATGLSSPHTFLMCL